MNQKEMQNTTFIKYWLKYSVAQIQNMNKFTDMEQIKTPEQTFESHLTGLIYILVFRMDPHSIISALNVLVELNKL